MTLMDDGRFVPFGAMVTLAGDGHSSFIVGDRGQVYLTGMSEQGTLIVAWGNQSGQQCRADFILPKQATYGGVTLVNALCRREH